ncbi:MAG: hypothetical protein V1790_19730 [Planctomycetota bacterium]
MTARRPKRATEDEFAYIRQVERESAFDLIDQGRARILAREDYPEPLRRFLEHERTIVHVKLSATTKRKLEARSRRTGLAVEELAKQWIEQGVRRDAV